MPTRPRHAARLLMLAAAPVCVLLALLAASPVALAAGGSASAAKRVLIVMVPLPEVRPPVDPPVEPRLEVEPVLQRLDARSELALGLSSAAQGTYDPVQAMLDITQGTRVSLSTYRPKRPQRLEFVVEGAGGFFGGWLAAKDRADSAPADVRPGLLATLVPGGTGYAGVVGRRQREAIAAADSAGRISLVSLGPARDVAQRAQALLARRALVVAGLPTGADGDLALDRLLAARTPDELVIVTQTPPRARVPQLLPTGITGLPGSGGQLTSRTTHLDGIVAGIDLLPTALGWLGRPVPSVVKGQPITVGAGRDAAGLETLADRLRVVLPRRLPALWTLLTTWLGVMLVAMLVADRRGHRWAMRIGPLALLWVPAVVLVTAALRPSRTLELALVTAFALALATLTDRFVAWPRGPAVPALVGVFAYLVDLAMGSPLIIRSLLGPNPLYGSRFYGIGNELEATLPSLLLIGLAALLAGRGRSRGAVAAFSGAGVVLALMMGAGRLGADVGGVITVAAGTATAAVLMLPGGVTKRALAAVVAAPLLGLAALAAIDLSTGGDSHFTRTVLRADGSGALWDIVARRYELAFKGLRRGFMPVATVLALLVIAVGAQRRTRLLTTLGGDPAYAAALWGLVAIGVAGALFNDSGPILLLFAAVIALGAVIYVRGDARLARAVEADH